MIKFVMVGTGKVGLTMARALRARGCQQLAFISRSRERAQQVASAEQVLGETSFAKYAAEADWVFLAVPDTYIADVCRQMEEQFLNKHTVVHFSGALSSAELFSASARGARVLSMHPLKSFASSEELPEALNKTLFALEGDMVAAKLAAELVTQLGGIPFHISQEQKTIYHAGAVVASNYLVALCDLATAMLSQVGIPSEYGLPGLLALSQGVFNNISQSGTLAALTGPIARGDVTTVNRHLESLTDLPLWQQIYKNLGIYTVGLAQAKGTIDGQSSEALYKILEG